VEARFSAPVQNGPGAHPATYTMSTGSFPGVKRPGGGVDHPPPSRAEVEGRVGLYICSPLGLRGLFYGNFTFLPLPLRCSFHPSFFVILHHPCVHFIMADTEVPPGISQVFDANITHCKAALNNGKWGYMCVYVTPVPIDQNLRAASSVTRGPFRKWCQFQVAVVVQILLLPSVSLHFQQKEKNIYIYQHD